ncbi:MAG: ribosome recycling factor [Bacteroidaceae bacterium]|nr:ribosome recycling factor [Bacteroidaceae bacterium]
MFDINKCLGEAEELMEMAIMHLEDEFAHIRAGKANVRILDDIRVNSYGSMVALNNVAALSTPDARTIAIRPWDKNMLKVIEKAIIDSSVGIMPTNNGEIIRLAIPPLTEERRRDLVKQSGKVTENTKVSVRNARRETIDTLKKAQKDGLPEDAEKDAEEKLQKLHDKYIKKADELFAEKEKEIMTV